MRCMAVIRQGSAQSVVLVEKKLQLQRSNINSMSLYNRVPGRVIRFNYTYDPNHSDNDGGRETRLIAFMDSDKV